MVRLLFLAFLGTIALLPARPADVGAAGGHLLWQADLDVDGGSVFALHGGFGLAAVHGRVVVVGDAIDAGGNRDFVVRALDAKTGRVVWSDRVDLTGAPLFNPSSTSVVTANERVIVSGGGTDAAGQPLALVRAYVTQTGVLVWKDSWRGQAVTQAVDGGRLLALGTVEDASGARQLTIRAYLAKTGLPLWQQAVAMPGGYTSFGPGNLAIRGRTAFLGAGILNPLSSDFDCLVRAYDAASGNVLWQTIKPVTGLCFPLTIDADHHRVVLGGSAGFDASMYAVFAFNAETGTAEWEDFTFNPANDVNVASAVDIVGGRTFVSGWLDVSVPPRRQEAFVVRAHDTRTGALLWEDQRSGPLGVQWRAFDLIAAGNRVFAVGDNIAFGGGGGAFLGTWLVRAYDAKRGLLLWEDEFQTPAVFGAFGGRAVAVDGGRVFVAGASFNAAGILQVTVRAYDAK